MTTEGFRREISAALQELADKIETDPEANHAFPTSYSSADRKYVHRIAESFGLFTLSAGQGNARHIVVYTRDPTPDGAQMAKGRGKKGRGGKGGPCDIPVKMAGGQGSGSLLMNGENGGQQSEMMRLAAEYDVEVDASGCGSNAGAQGNGSPSVCGARSPRGGPVAGGGICTCPCRRSACTRPC